MCCILNARGPAPQLQIGQVQLSVPPQGRHGSVGLNWPGWKVVPVASIHVTERHGRRNVTLPVRETCTLCLVMRNLLDPL